MIFYAGIKKRKCRIDGDDVIVDGESYKISYIEEIEDYKIKYEVSFWVCVVGGLILSPFIYKAIVYGVFLNDDVLDRTITGAFMLVALIIYLFIVWMIYRSLGYSSYWKMSSSKYILLEKNDYDDAYFTLKALENKTKSK